MQPEVTETLSSDIRSLEAAHAGLERNVSISGGARKLSDNRAFERIPVDLEIPEIAGFGILACKSFECSGAVLVGETVRDSAGMDVRSRGPPLRGGHRKLQHRLWWGGGNGSFLFRTHGAGFVAPSCENC